MRRRGRLLTGAAVAALVCLAFARRLLDYVFPFLLALFVAAVIDPLVDRLERGGVPRALGALGTIGALFLGGIGFLWLLAANVAAELLLLRDQLPYAAEHFEVLVDRLAKLMGPLVSAVPHPLDDALKSAAGALLDTLMNVAAQGVARLGALPSLVTVLFVSGMAAYFLSRDKRELGAFLWRILPRRWHKEARRLKEEIVSGLLGYVRAQSILVAVSGGLSIAGLSLFGYRYAWIFGGLAGILDLVPMVGPSAVYAPIVLLAAAAGDWPRALGIAAVWAGVLVVRQVIEPEVVGKHVGLHPLTSIVAVYLGGKLFGVNGILLGPILAVTLKAVCVVSILPYLKQESG